MTVVSGRWNTLASWVRIEFLGDLVHNFNWKSITQHFEEDWKAYNSILRQTNVTQFTTWLDMRGNHGNRPWAVRSSSFLSTDTFRDAHPESQQSFYRSDQQQNSLQHDVSFYRLYSHQGKHHTSSYQYTLKTKDNDTYSFVSIDMTRQPGASLPFNFFGEISQVNDRVSVNRRMLYRSQF